MFNPARAHLIAFPARDWDPMVYHEFVKGHAAALALIGKHIGHVIDHQMHTTPQTVFALYPDYPSEGMAMLIHKGTLNVEDLFKARDGMLAYFHNCNYGRGSGTRTIVVAF